MVCVRGRLFFVVMVLFYGIIPADPYLRLDMENDESNSPGDKAMIKPIVLSGLTIALAVLPVQAQVTVDVAKITCDQFTGYKVTNPQNIAIWLSGYYNGKRDNTIVETQSLIADAKKLRDYCIRNPQAPVMRAVETLFDKGKK